MFTLKYKPNKLEDFIGNKLAIKSIIKWLLEWNPTNKKNKCALISGVNGIGKTLLSELVLKKHDYNIINLNMDDDNDKNYINHFIKPLLKTKKTFDSQENAIVISDIDCNNDYGFISSILECIKETEIPIICICDDRYSQRIKPILNYCYDIKLQKPSYDEIYKLVYKVVIQEKIKIGESSVKKIYAQSNGDIRYILNTLQLNVKNIDTNKNIKNSNIFDTTAKILSMDTELNDKIDTYWLADDIHNLMIHENYINNIMNSKCDIKKIDNLCNSAFYLSDSDLFETSVNMANWELMPYIAYSTIQSTQTCNKKSLIKFPQFLGKISTMNKNKKEKLDYNNIKLNFK